jgi:hypothetical protein
MINTKSEMAEWWRAQLALWDTMSTWDNFADPEAARAEVVALLSEFLDGQTG